MGVLVLCPSAIPITRFTDPAISPFTTVVWAGVKPSNSAVRLLSMPQHMQALTTNPPALQPSAPSGTARRMPPASTSPPASTDIAGPVLADRDQKRWTVGLISE